MTIKKSPIRRSGAAGDLETGETQGISPKAALAGIVPAIGTILTVIVTGFITGEFDRTEEVEAAVGLIASMVAAASAYLGSPGDVRYKTVKQPIKRGRAR
jgi:hypothetical protein